MTQPPGWQATATPAPPPEPGHGESGCGESGLDDLFSPLHRGAMAQLLAQTEALRAQSARLAGHRKPGHIPKLAPNQVKNQA